MLAATVTLAARNLARHRVRTLISLSAIAFGVAALLLAGGFIEWIFWALRDSVIHAGTGHVQITRPGFRTEGFADPRAYLLPARSPELDTVRHAPGVGVVSERLMLSGLVSSGETTVAFTGQAGEPDAERRLSPNLKVTGQDLAASDADGVLLGEGLATALGVKPGDAITLLVNLPRGGVNAADAQVRGVFSTGVKDYDDRALRLPLVLGRRLLRVDGAHVWVLSLGPGDDDATATLDYLRAKLPANRFDVASWRDLSDFYRKAVVLLSRQVDVVGALVALIIVLGISNTLMMNVLERTGEIGTLMALGTRRRAILGLFLTDGVLLGLAGGLVGLAAGYVLGTVLSHFGIPMPPPPGRSEGYSAAILLTPPLALIGFCIGVGATAIAALYPAWKAAHLPIVDALRHNR
jgi:putative ABC transport system permease protein